MDPSIQTILEPSEQVTWSGAVSRPVLFTKLIIMLGIVCGIGFYFLVQDNVTVNVNDVPKQFGGATIGLWIIIIGVFLGVLIFLSNFVKQYATTNKRVIIKSGLIGTDFQSIYFEQMQGVLVNVGLLGKIFGVGTVQIDTGKMETVTTGDSGSRGRMGSTTTTKPAYDVLQDITTPYEVYKQLQAVLSQRKESLYSGRADRESNPEAYQK